MSSILEALRKSERARRAGRAPVYHDGSSTNQAFLLRGLSMAAGGTLVAALVLSAWLLNRPDPAGAIATKTDLPPEEVVSASRKDVRAGVEPETADPSRARSFAAVAGSAPRPSGQPKPAIQTAPVNAGLTEPAPWLSALPDEFRASLPKLVITIHVYAAEEAQRILYINNRPLQRGSELEGVTVEEIVPEGAVLRTRGQRFRIPRPS